MRRDTSILTQATSDMPIRVGGRVGGCVGGRVGGCGRARRRGFVCAIVACATGALLAGGLGACRQVQFPRQVIRGNVDPTGRAWPFAATTLRVYPLTRVDRDSEGRPVLIAYIETVDRWGDFAKALGTLEVRLYAGDRAIGAGPDTQELTWPRIDLSNLEENASWYDPASKMYRLTLGGLSRSPRAIDAAEALLDRASPTTKRLRVVTVLQSVGPDGKEIFLQDQYVIER